VRITGAELIASYYFSQYGSATVGVYEVPYSWNKNTITWNNSVASHQVLENSTEPFTQEPLSGSSEASPYTVHFDITEAVSGWYAGRTNNGIAIKCQNSYDSGLVICGYNYYNQNNYYSCENLRFEITYQNLPNTYDGTYYFRNNEIDTYIETDRSDIMNFDVARLGAFNGDTDQRWSVTYLHNGYYSIKSCVNAEALTAYLEDDNEINLATYAATDNQMWSITKDSNGIYKISPKNNSTSRVTFGAIINSSEPNERYLVLSQSSSTANGNEWIFYEVSTDGVNFEYQEESNWCWAACAKMISSAFIDNLSSQQDAAEYAVMENWIPSYGPLLDYNQTGDFSHIEDALQYMFGKVNVYTNGAPFNPKMTLSILESGNPIVALINNGGHWVVIYRCEVIDMIDDIPRLLLYVYDPYNHEKHGDGIQRPYYYTVEYDDLVYGIYNQGWSKTLIFDQGWDYEPMS